MAGKWRKPLKTVGFTEKKKFSERSCQNEIVVHLGIFAFVISWCENG